MQRLLAVSILWMSLLALPFAVLLAVDAVNGPSTHAAADHCTRACHDRGCAHLPRVVDTSRPVVRAAREVYVANIRALAAPSIGYRDTNLLVYVVGFPALYAVILLVLLLRWPVAWRWPVALASSGIVAALLAGVLARIEVFGAWGSGRTALYWLCTDFCIHMGNATGLTYEGFNFALFVVGFPLTGIALAVAVVVRSAPCQSALRFRRPGGDDPTVPGASGAPS